MDGYGLLLSLVIATGYGRDHFVREDNLVRTRAQAVNDSSLPIAAVSKVIPLILFAE